MPVATPKQYEAMLDAAQKGGYAYPAVNITVDRDHQCRPQGVRRCEIGWHHPSFYRRRPVRFWSKCKGRGLRGHRTCRGHPCFGGEVRCTGRSAHGPLPSGKGGRISQASARSVSPSEKIAEGKGPLFQSHMFDGSVVSLDENLEISKELLKECAELDIILEVEAGCVGGEEDGHDTSGLPAEKLYTTPEDMLEVYEALQPIGRFLFAATFGNVHGAYKPGAVQLKPTILRDGQKAVMDKHGAEAEMDLVFHGGSGSELSEIRETLDYGVVKMNIDTDTQYAFTRPMVTHIGENIEGVLKIDGEVGNKKTYDPRSYLKKAEESMANRLITACEDPLGWEHHFRQGLISPRQFNKNPLEPVSK